MNIEPLVAAIIVGVLSGMASAWANLIIFGERLRRLSADVERLSAAVEGEDGLQVRVAVLERRP